MKANIINVPNKYHQPIKKTVIDFIRSRKINPDCTINIEFVSKEKIKSLNNKYRQTNKTTDVLSFPIWEKQDKMPKRGIICLGDIIICPRMTAIDKELDNLIKHSLDHLVGKHH